MPFVAARRRNPPGWCRLRPICGVARCQRCHHIASSSLLASRPQAAPAKGKGFSVHYTRIGRQGGGTLAARMSARGCRHARMPPIRGRCLIPRPERSPRSVAVEACPERSRGAAQDDVGTFGALPASQPSSGGIPQPGRRLQGIASARERRRFASATPRSGVADWRQWAGGERGSDGVATSTT